jgi:hypothetical protein
MTTATLTPDQKACLEYMDYHHLGAVCFEGDWRFKEAFRRDPKMAERFKTKMITPFNMPIPLVASDPTTPATDGPLRRQER